ncbi:hypothetical protein [Zavarzinia aquatilis]|uniref:hypothetical protein n=1 Tax=Zavarzinia aquatilis TaxID=2211142 RepID=UPI0010578510|nr:hypothetical protein [Zavarzinia aquatilis]
MENDGLFTALSRHWQPAGCDDPRQPGLRLAVRNGYLNFYRLGQSVAKLGFDRRGRLHAEVHHKYLDGNAAGQKYEKLTTADGLSEWIERCEGFTSKEKCFVDRVVGRNAGVIDLEMALPAGHDSAGRKIAPRVDLVALERTTAGHRIVFWEVKLATDARVRRQGDARPEVVEQLETYGGWLRDHADMVAEAYRENCRVLRDLHHAAATRHPLGETILDVANGDLPLEVDPVPRLLIADFRGDDQKGAGSFAANGHEAKLRTARCRLHVVRNESDLTLPVLP